MLDTSPLSDVVLPPHLTPTSPVNGSRNVAQLDDTKTGVLALGSFDDPDFDSFLDSLLTGLITLKSLVQANLWWIWYVFLHAFGVKMMNYGSF